MALTLILKQQGAIAVKGFKAGKSRDEIKKKKKLVHCGDLVGHEISRSKMMVAKCFESEADFHFEKGKLVFSLSSQRMHCLLTY